MVSVKLILRKDKSNSVGEHPLYIRITKNRKPKYLSLGFYLKLEWWDAEGARVRKPHPNSQRLNNYLSVKVAEAQAVALEMETKDKTIQPHKIKEQIMGKAPSSLIRFAKSYLLDLEGKMKIGTYRKTKSVLFKIVKYNKGRDLLFEDVTVKWLKDYEQYLKRVRGNSVNTINANFRTLRGIFNLAINEELLPYDKNPFRRFKLSTEKVKKNYLSEDELKLIELAPIELNSKKDVHRDMYVFSAYTGGLRISDMLLLRWRNFDGERVIMQTKKTASTISIKIPTTAMQIIHKYSLKNQQPDDFIFPIFKNDVDYSDPEYLFNSISSATAYTNGDLKDIAKLVGLKKHISFHTARHTFATRALMKGVRIEYVSKLLGHSSIATTQIYAKIVNEELDKAMAVFD